MKNESPIDTSPLPSEERLVDAALEEHARLGSSRNDNALIDRILLETVNKDSNTIAIGASVSTPWRSLIIGVSSAAAVLTLGVFFLQSFQLRDTKRSEQEVHFVVRILDEAPSDESELITSAPPVIAAQSNSRAIEPTFAQVDAVVSPLHSDGSYFLETRFGKSLSEFPTRAHRHNSFLISAEEVVQAANETHFGGHVAIGHETWKIEATAATVQNGGNVGGNKSDPSPSLSASNVIVMQENPKRTVHAKKLIFDAVSGNLILTGVKTLSAAEGNMTNFKPSDELTLTENSYSIQSQTPVKYASPNPVKPGKK